jgi:hypothetical protein
MKITTFEDEAVFAQCEAGEWLDCEFEDLDSGERFFVELKVEVDETAEEFVDRCFDMALEDFDEVEFVAIVPAEIAEIMGYDTY